MMNQKIKDALQVLYEEGLKHINPEYRDDANRFECIGMAMAEELSSKNIAQVAYSAWEDMNAHAACSVINWFFKLYPDSYHISDLKSIKWLIDKQEIELKTEWNWDKVDHDTARFRVSVSWEELKPVL